jgi:hypothetical protein
VASKIIIQALDALALALTEHVHEWSARERGLYEQSISSLFRKGFDLSASKKRSPHEPSIGPMLLSAQA